MATLYSPKIITDGLVFCVDAANPKSYPNAGTSWYDLSNNDINGTMSAGVIYDNMSKGSMCFSGTNSVNFGSNNTLNFATDYSFQFWINPEKSNFGSIIYRIDQNSFDGYNFDITSDSGLFCAGKGGIGILVAFTYTNAFTYNKTDNFAIVSSGYIANTYNRLNIYKNGTLVRQGLIAPTNTSANFFIGNGTNQMTGRLFNMLAYNRTLTQAEVLQNYNATKGRFI